MSGFLYNVEFAWIQLLLPQAGFSIGLYSKHYTKYCCISITRDSAPYPHHNCYCCIQALMPCWCQGPEMFVIHVRSWAFQCLWDARTRRTSFPHTRLPSLLALRSCRICKASWIKSTQRIVRTSTRRYFGFIAWFSNPCCFVLFDLVTINPPSTRLLGDIWNASPLHHQPSTHIT